MKTAICSLGSSRSYSGIAKLVLLALSGILALFLATGCASESAGAASSDPTNLTSELYGNLKDFTTTTLDGGTFSSSDIADYDITMVNVWRTDCPFCIQEMKGIELLYQDLPDNVNLVSVCIDADINGELAQQILDDHGVTFPTLLNSDSLMDCFVSNISGVPTTVYVNSEGDIVGYPQVGAPNVGDDSLVAKRYRDQIQDCLDKVA